MSKPVPDQLRSARVLIAPLLVGALAGGCASSVSPQLFPARGAVSAEECTATDPREACKAADLQEACNAYPRIRDTTREGAARWPFDGQQRLCGARERADLLRQEYVEAVVEQSAQKSVLNTLLLSIGAVAGYHLLKHGLSDSSSLRYLAVGGGALYGYATLTQSQARQVVYLTGAEALSCIYAASDELQISPAELRAVVDDNAELRASAEYLQLRLGQAFEQDYGRPGRCKTKAPIPADCLSGAEGAGKKLFDAARPTECVDRPAVKTCDGSLARAAQALEPEISEAEELQAQVAMKLNEIERLGGRVRAATDSVSYAISREVLKTEASPATVLTTIESMRGVVSQLIGTAQKGPPLPPAVDKRARHPMLEAALYRIRNAKARVREHDRTLAARLKAFQEKIGMCQDLETMARISVEPNLEQLTLVPDRPFTVLATGSNATPSVNLLGDPDNAVHLQSEPIGKQIKAVLTLKKTDRSVAASLQFSAPGAVSVTVPVVYFKPSDK